MRWACHFGSEMWDMTVGPASDSTRSTSGAFDTSSLFHWSYHQPRSPPAICSTSCHPDRHAQASEVLWQHHPFWLRRGSYTCPQCWNQWLAEGLETTLCSPSSNMATHHRERPQTSEPAWWWGCGRPGTELMTVISGLKSWKWRRSCRGMLHDDDDDFDNAL